jgi:CubicO group peptidase (beta-lactamase class C family)
MKRFLIAAIVAFGLAAPAAAQTPIAPSTPNILFWKGEQQAAGYRTIEKIYRTHVIQRGSKVHPLPVASRRIDPTWSYAGKTWTVDAYMKAYRVSGLLVLKDGKILLERYGLGRKPTDRWTSFSVAKSITSTLVGAAIQDGKIKSLEDPVTRYIPRLKGSAYDGVSVRDMLMMSSGVQWNEDYADPNSDVAQAGTKMLQPGVDPMVSYLRKLPRAHKPGSEFHYNTGETDLVGILVSNAVGEPLATYASQKIWKPYGMEQDAIWLTDLADRERGGCCISMTLRDYARVGEFILDGGKANGKPVVPSWWIGQATTREIDNGSGPDAGYGYFWWIRSPDRYDAVGIFGQSITTFRKARVIVVQNAAWPQAVGRELSAARNAMVAAMLNAAE